MTALTPSSYQPFLIGSGQAKTGLFSYLESWQAPEDAFDNIQDAYVNRGQVWKRDGQSFLGVLTYCSSQLLTYGNGGTNYAGSFSANTPRGAHVPILAGSVTVQTRVAAGPDATETYTDNGAGVLTGNLGGTGTINYTTGAWTINSAIAVNNGSPIMIDYTYTPTTATNPKMNVSVVAIAPGAPNPLTGTFGGVFTQNLPITPGSVFFVVDTTAGGPTTYFDDGVGNLRASLPAGPIVGTINYTTGAWAFVIPAADTAVAFSAIQMGLTPVANTAPIMGINQWNDEDNNTFQLVVEDTRRAAVYNLATNLFDPLCFVQETLFIVPPGVVSGVTIFDNAIAGTFVIPTFALIAPLSITLTLLNPLTGHPVASTLGTPGITTDDGAGGIVPTAYFTSGTVNYYTGEFKIILQNGAGGAGAGQINLAAGMAINVTFNLQNDYFFGDTSNFFNWINWEPSTNQIVTIPASPIPAGDTQPEESTQFQRGFLYLTNNFDPITLYRKGRLSRPAFAVQQANLGRGRNEILRALDVKTFASRLLIVRPTTTISDGNPDPQSIRWSAQFQPTNTVADIPGSGGELSAATSDWINSTKFLKDFNIVNMQNSVWTFRFTGSAFAPFVFFKINSTKNTSAPYGSIEFDDQITSMGSKGLIFCDGVAVDRYDWKIFDQFEDINADAFIQCFGQRFDILNQSWMLYPSDEVNALLSNKVLLHNYAEDSWATFNMALSCLGIGFGIKDFTWADFAPGGLANPAGDIVWGNLREEWASYLNQAESLRLLGGDFTGKVLQLNDGPTDNGTPITFNVTTKKYNPFAPQGVKAQFGYIDVYYTVNPLISLTFNFFIDNATDDTPPAFDKTIQLIGTNNAPYGWQRVFLNVQAAQLQWQMVDNGVAGFKILGMILWARPAGRLTQ